jgi:3-oxoacyl-[acyl-carrier protein] reductase
MNSCPFHKDFAGKTALITGATAGIGEAIARRFYMAGCHLIITGRRLDKLEALKASLISSETDQTITCVPCDLANLADVTNLIDQAGEVDILVNNGGMTKDTLCIRMQADDWDRVLAVNLTSVFHLTKGIVTGMMKRRSGRIINISSVVGVTGNAGQTNYAATKAGLIGFTKSLAQEVAKRGITVNCVAPGFIETNMTDGLSDGVRDQILSSIPQQRMGNVDDIAPTVVFLASENATYITGQTIHINGGMCMI